MSPLSGFCVIVAFLYNHCIPSGFLVLSINSSPVSLSPISHLAQCVICHPFRGFALPLRFSIIITSLRDYHVIHQFLNGFPATNILCNRSSVFFWPQRLRKASRSISSRYCSVTVVACDRSPPHMTYASFSAICLS